MLISCRKAARLASEQMERPLTRMERMSLKIHGVLCGPCHRYGSQINGIHDIMPHLDEHISENGNSLPCLSEAACAKIRSLLSKDD